MRAGALIAFVAVAAFALSDGPQRLIDVAFYPWAHADPPLLDRWAGRLTAGNGDNLELTLVLRRTAPQSDGLVCTRCNQIEGEAVTCDARGEIRRYRLSGTPDDRPGHLVRFGTSPERSPPPEGLELDALSGTWDGGDTLTLQAGFFWRRASSAISSSGDRATRPVPVRLRRLPATTTLADPSGCG